MLFPSRIVRAWRGRIAATLALLLTISIVGQQLPCMHATTSGPTSASTSAPTPLANQSGTRQHEQHQQAAQASVVHEHAGTTHATEPVPAPLPAHNSHHDPAAPGCAQLMACGLVVQAETTTVEVLSTVAVSREAPVGVPLAFTTAELEVESPPPRA